VLKRGLELMQIQVKWAGIISKWDSTGWMMVVDSNTTNLYFTANSGQFIGPYTLTIGLWYSRVITYDVQHLVFM